MKEKIIILVLFSFIFNFSFSQDTERDLLMKAISEINYKKYDNAKKIITNLILENSLNKDYYLTLGECYFKQKKYEKANSQFKLAIKNKSKKAYYKVAECYSLLNNELKAIEYLKLYLKTSNKLLQSQIKTNPNFANINNSKTWTNVWKTKYYTNYELKLDDALYLTSKGDFTNAYDILDKLIIQNKQRHKAHEMRGDLLFLDNDYTNAAKEYKKASDIKKHNINYIEKTANAYFKARSYKKSLKYCNKAILEKRHSANIYLLKAKNKKALKKYNSAENLINKFLTFYPNNSEALNLAGTILYSKKEYLEALKKYNLLLADKNNAKVKAKYYINRADAYMAVSMYENTTKDLSMALDLNPKQKETYYKRGFAKLKSKDQNGACKDFKRAYNLGYYKASDMLMKYCN